MANVTCPHCGLAREVDPARIPKEKVRVRCKRCGQGFELDGAALEAPLELDWGARAPAATAAPEMGAPPGPIVAPPAPAYAPVAAAPPPPSPTLFERVPLQRYLPLAGVLLLLALGGRCALSCVDRPSFLGLAWSSEGASLSRARAVVVFLHGFGGSGGDVEWFAEDLLERPGMDSLAFVLPDGTFTRGLGRAWWRTNDPAERAESLQRVLELVDAVAAKGVPYERIYVGGFSQGAMLAADVAAAHPGPLGGAILLSGCGYARSELPEMRVFVGHGRRDSVCAFGAGQSLAHALEKAGRAVTFFPYEGDHELTGPLRGAVARFLAEAQ